MLLETERAGKAGLRPFELERAMLLAQSGKTAEGIQVLEGIVAKNPAALGARVGPVDVPADAWLQLDARRAAGERGSTRPGWVRTAMPILVVAAVTALLVGVGAALRPTPSVETTVPATTTGVWRLRYGGNSVAGPAYAIGDSVQVTR